MKTIEKCQYMSDLICVVECISTQSCMKSNFIINSGYDCSQCVHPHCDLTASHDLKSAALCMLAVFVCFPDHFCLDIFLIYMFSYITCLETGENIKYYNYVKCHLQKQ